MNEKEFKKTINEDYSELYFEYNGKKCGIDFTANKGILTYEMWYGNKLKEYDDLDVLLNDDFFDGKTLREMLDTIEFI